MVIITFRFQQTCSAYRLAAKYRRKEITFSWLLIYLPDNRNKPKSLNIQLANIAVYFHQSTQYGRNASHVTMSAVCDHAALRPRCRFRASALARSALRPCPTACMRECFHRCVRWEDEEVTAGCSVQRCHKFIYVKGKRGGRGREGGLAMCASWTPQNIYAWRAAVTASLTFGNSNNGNTPVAAAFTKLRAWPSVCVVLCYLITSFWQISNGRAAHATPSHNYCGLLCIICVFSLVFSSFLYFIVHMCECHMY